MPRIHAVNSHGYFTAVCHRAQLLIQVVAAEFVAHGG